MQRATHFPKYVKVISMKHKTIPVFVPHMGCPNDCSFCNQRKITGTDTKVTEEVVENQIKEALITVSSDDFVEIGFFGGSFTGIERDTQNKFLKIAKKYVDMGKVNAIRLSTRPDYIDDDILKNLKSFGVTTIELGAQSMDDSVLLKNRRGHTYDDIVKASRLIKEHKISLGIQMMTGLFGDSDATCMKSLEKIVTLHPDCVRIYPTLVLRDTYLHKLYEEGLYTPQTLDDAVKLCADLKERFDEENIPVIRIGLMTSDNINPDVDVVAGPYHPSIGELVLSEIYLRKILKEIKRNSKILVNPKDISAFVGNKKSNIEKLKSAGYSVTFKADENIKTGDFKIL